MADQETGKLEFWMLEMADLEYNYNPIHQIIRVKWQDSYYDLKCNPGFLVPNIKDHLVIAILPEGFFDVDRGIDKFRHSLPPGLKTESGVLADVPRGICLLTPKRQTLSTTNPQTANMSISNTNMFDLDNVTVAISPHLPGRDYTTEDSENSGDINNENVGFFINKQGTILIKSTGASLTLGKEGIHVGGKFASESSIRDTGVMSDGPFKHIIPSTMVTAWAGISIPNMGTISSIANASMKYIEIISKSAQIGGILVNLSSSIPV